MEIRNANATEELSRRSFLRMAGVAAGGLVAIGFKRSFVCTRRDK
jgi:hypothetical protein